MQCCCNWAGHRRRKGVIMSPIWRGPCKYLLRIPSFSGKWTSTGASPQTLLLSEIQRYGQRPIQPQPTTVWIVGHCCYCNVRVGREQPWIVESPLDGWMDRHLISRWFTIALLHNVLVPLLSLGSPVIVWYLYISSWSIITEWLIITDFCTMKSPFITHSQNRLFRNNHSLLCCKRFTIALRTVLVPSSLVFRYVV